MLPCSTLSYTKLLIEIVSNHDVFYNNGWWTMRCVSSVLRIFRVSPRNLVIIHTCLHFNQANLKLLRMSQDVGYHWHAQLKEKKDTLKLLQDMHLLSTKWCRSFFTAVLFFVLTSYQLKIAHTAFITNLLPLSYHGMISQNCNALI